MTESPQTTTTATADAAFRPEDRAAPFGSNELRLSPREWLIAGAILAALFWLGPSAWERVEPVEFSADYRIPYRLGQDYSLYARWCRDVATSNRTLLLGDSVVWGHYVSADQTLSHYLNAQGGGDRFANLGVDGIHPAAMAGLVEYYGRAVRGKRVIVYCNPLWMSSPTHDLAGEKEFAFNHPRLVPQFAPRIGCYKESFDGRLGIVVGRCVPLLGWVNHLRIAYFDDADLVDWTLEHPYRNPLWAVTLDLPSPWPAPDPLAAKPWTTRDIRPYNPPWGELDASLQWNSLQTTIATLESRGNRVFVVVGPFNEPMLKPESLAKYRKMKRAIAQRLTEGKLPHCVAPVLPSALYADASHPLAEGYAQLAGQLLKCDAFAAFCAGD
jgi:hypothetical protein